MPLRAATTYVNLFATLRLPSLTDQLLDLLDKITSADATTSSRVLNYLNTKIPTLPPTLTTSQPLPPRPPKHTTPASSLLSVPNPFPNPGSFLTAPALPVSAFKNGKRRIPYLVSANKIPMIRFRKPQPPALSAYISNRNRTRQKRTNRLHACEDAVAVAEREDEWDFILAEQGARERDGFGNGDGQGEERFVEAAQMAFDEVSGLINRDAIRLREVGERMWAFVQREKGLAARERAERKKERTDKKRERNKRRAETWRERTAEARDERVESELVERVSRTA
ncbi:hypothetical protein MBLNU457_5360t2 [Dothideomycetes sp. NU457]